MSHVLDAGSIGEPVALYKSIETVFVALTRPGFIWITPAARAFRGEAVTAAPTTAPLTVAVTV